MLPRQPARGKGKGQAGGRGQPRVIKGDKESSAASGTAKGPPSGSAIDTLRLFLLSRYSPEIRMLNLEHMAEDSILRDAGLLAPGQKGAPSNMAGALWKLAATEFSNVRWRMQELQLPS